MSTESKSDSWLFLPYGSNEDNDFVMLSELLNYSFMHICVISKIYNTTWVFRFLKNDISVKICILNQSSLQMVKGSEGYCIVTRLNL